MTIGERIKQRRLELGLSQEDVALKAGYKSRSSVNKLENSRNLPLTKVEKMANALECTPGYLMGWEEQDRELTSMDHVVKIIKKNYKAETTETIKDYDYQTLKIIFDKFGYILKPFSVRNLYTLQHKKQARFFVVISARELNTMIYDISDYIGELLSKRMDALLSDVRTKSSELNAANARTDIEVTEEMKQHDDAFFDEED